MAKINFLTELDNNVGTGSSGTMFYPVTTANAVYISPTRTLSSILNGEYNETNNTTDNGIYNWLENLSKRFSSYVLNSSFSELDKKVDSFSSSINNNRNDINAVSSNLTNVSSNFSKEIKRIEDKIYVPVFDDSPLKGSQNLVTSGGLYAFFSKLIQNNMLSFKTVVDLDDYDGFNGEVVLYIGETNERYMFGCLYQCMVSFVRDPESVCANRTKVKSWKVLGSILNSSGVDLSNYYNKTTIDTMFRNIKTNGNVYYPGKNITIDANNNISAIITPPDLSDYYNKRYIDNTIDELRRSLIKYTAGENIQIVGNVISAKVPSIDDITLPEQTKYKITSSDNTLSVSERKDGNTVNIDLGVRTLVNDVKVDGVSVVQNHIANITVPKLDVSAKTTALNFGSTDTIATINSNDIKVTLPAKPTATVTNNTTTLAFGQQKTIATIDGTDVKVTMPAAPPSVSVASKTTTLSFGGTHTVGTVNGADFKVTMPSKPTATVSDKATTLSYGQTHTIATVDNQNITVKMPDAPAQTTVTVTDYTTQAAFGQKTEIADINGSKISVTLPSTPSVSVTNYSPTLSWGSINTIAKVGTQDITVTMPAKPSSSTTISVGNVLYSNIRYMKYGRIVIVSFDGITKTNLDGAKIPTNSSIGNLNPINDITLYTSCTGYDNSQGDNGYYFGQVILDSGSFRVQNIINGNAKIYGQMMYLISE